MDGSIKMVEVFFSVYKESRFFNEQFFFKVTHLLIVNDLTAVIFIYFCFNKYLKMSNCKKESRFFNKKFQSNTFINS